MLRIALIMLLLVPSICFGNTITKDSITWTFNGTYPTGQYVTGDWYVVAPSGLQVTGISATGTYALGGSQKNPSPGGSQGYSSAGLNYNASLNVGSSFPISLSPGDRLVTTTKYPYYGVFNPTTNEKNYTAVQEAAILTVVASAPAAGSFRPGLCDLDNVVYNVSSINWGLLKSVAPAVGSPTLSEMTNLASRPWIDHQIGQAGRSIHPNYNMRDYGGELATDIGHMALIVNSNTYTQSQKTPIVIGLIQMGLDFYSNVKRNHNFYSPVPVQILGRKFPIMFAGNLLNIAEIKAIWPKTGVYLFTGNGAAWGTYPTDAYKFSEDATFYYVRSQDVTATASFPTSYPPDNDYTSAMVGMPEWHHYDYDYRKKDTSAWNPTTGADPYRFLYGPSMEGIAAAVKIMGWKTQWNHQAFWDYLARFSSICRGQGELPPNYSVVGDTSCQGVQYSAGWGVNMYTQYVALASPTCNADNLGSCDATSCAAAGLYWYNNTCNLHVQGWPAEQPTNIQPSGELPSGTTSANLSVSTSEDETCRWSTSDSAVWSAMTNFATTGARMHSQPITGLIDGGVYHRKILCQDAYGNETNPVYSDFNVAVNTDICSPANWWRCDNESDCTGIAGGYWFGDPGEESCYLIPEVDDTSGYSVINNGNFQNWSGGLPGIWEYPYGYDPSGGCSISEDSGKLRAATTTTAWPPCGVRQLAGTKGDGIPRRIYFNITALTDQAEMYTSDGISTFFTAPGSYTAVIPSGYFYLQVHTGAVRSATFDDVIVRQIGSAPVAPWSLGVSYAGVSKQ